MSGYRGIYEPYHVLTQSFEAAPRTRVEFLWDGQAVDACEYVGGTTEALDKAIADREARARCGGLPKGRHEVRARGETRCITVD